MAKMENPLYITAEIGDVAITSEGEETWKGTYQEYGELLGIIQGERQSLDVIFAKFGLGEPSENHWVEDLKLEILASLFQS
jgi:hypothetical protein